MTFDHGSVKMNCPRRMPQPALTNFVHLSREAHHVNQGYVRIPSYSDRHDFKPPNIPAKNLCNPDLLNCTTFFRKYDWFLASRSNRIIAPSAMFTHHQVTVARVQECRERAFKRGSRGESDVSRRGDIWRFTVEDYPSFYSLTKFQL